MFSEQIRLLTLLIDDWDNIETGVNNHGWLIDEGLCANCLLSMNDIADQLNQNLIDAHDFKEAMWFNWSGYSGSLLYPLYDHEESFCHGGNFTKTPERLDLAKSCLEFLTGYVDGTIKV